MSPIQIQLRTVRSCEDAGSRRHADLGELSRRFLRGSRICVGVVSLSRSTVVRPVAYKTVFFCCVCSERPFLFFIYFFSYLLLAYGLFVRINLDRYDRHSGSSLMPEPLSRSADWAVFRVPDPLSICDYHCCPEILPSRSCCVTHSPTDVRASIIVSRGRG